MDELHWFAAPRECMSLADLRECMSFPDFPCGKLRETDVSLRTCSNGKIPREIDGFTRISVELDPGTTATRVWISFAGQHAAEFVRTGDATWSFDGIHAFSWSSLRAERIETDGPSEFTVHLRAFFVERERRSVLYCCTAWKTPLGCFWRGIYAGKFVADQLTDKQAVFVDCAGMSPRVVSDLAEMIPTMVQIGETLFVDTPAVYMCTRGRMAAVKWGHCAWRAGKTYVCWKPRFHDPCDHVVEVDVATSVAIEEAKRRRALADGRTVVRAASMFDACWILMFDSAWGRRRPAVGACWLNEAY